MMKMTKMTALLAAILMLIGCDSNPIRPTTINGVPITTQKAAKAESHAAQFDSTQLGHATLDGIDYRVGLQQQPGVCYQRDFYLYKDTPLFIIFNANDRVNQIDVAHTPFTTQHFTLSDFASGPIGADATLWCTPTTPVPPTTPPVAPPPPPPPPAPTCPGSGSLDFTYLGEKSWMATEAPWYPSKLGPFQMPGGTIPQGIYHMTAVTRDPNHPTDAGDQAVNHFEQVKFRFTTMRGDVVTPATSPIPNNVTTMVTDLGNVTLIEQTFFVGIEHAGPLLGYPADSVQPVSLTWTRICQ